MKAQSGPIFIEVEDLAVPGLEPYRNQKDAWLRVQQFGGTGLGGLFMAEGEIVVRELIASIYEVCSVLITTTRLDSMRDAIGSLPSGTPVFVTTRDVAEDIVGFDMHRGILALGRCVSALSMTELAHRARCLLVLEGLSNHDNIGSLYRCLSALGPAESGVVLGPGCADPFYRKSLRVSMGHVLRIPTARANDWPGSLQVLGDLGFEVLALTPDADAKPLHEAALRCPPSRVALVLGAEGPGLTPAALRACGRRARVPMNPGVDSLNVAVSAAIALSWICKTGPGGEQAPAGSV